MAEDDLNEAPKTVAEQPATDQETTTVKKKAVRKRTPQAKATAKKKVSVKKKAAPKKKAARKSGVAANAKTTQTDAAVAEQSAPPQTETAPDYAATATPNAAEDTTSETSTEPPQPAVAAPPVDEQAVAPAEPTAQMEPPPASVSGEAAPEPAATSPRNENVQKRLEEMGLMPSDSTEKQTPPPAKRSGSGLGFWQKSFIWTIVIIAGLLYLRTITSPGHKAGDEMANRDAQVNKTEQVAENATPAESAQTTSMESSVARAATDEPAILADAGTGNTNPAAGQAANSDTPIDTSKDTAATEATTANAEEAAVPATQMEPAATGTDTTTASQAPAGEQTAVAAPVTTARAPTETDQGSASTAPEPAVAPSTFSEPSQTATIASIEADKAPAGTGAESEAPSDNLQTMPGMASRFGRAGMQPMWGNAQRYMMPMMPNRFATTPSSNAAGTNSGTTPADSAENPTNQSQQAQAPANIGQRYPFRYPRSFVAPGYPWSVNPQTTPYYWPYPPRPPVYGPVVRYPYHYPQATK